MKKNKGNLFLVVLKVGQSHRCNPGLRQRVHDAVSYTHLHCYWRTGGDVFGGAQIMGVVHGLEKDAVLEHKAAVSYTHLINRSPAFIP